MKNIIFIISISSDIGLAFAEKKIREGYKIYGTYRTRSQKLSALEKEGATLYNCDLTSNKSISEAINYFSEINILWDILMVASGDVSPIGPFIENDMDAWEHSIRVNFLGVMRLCQGLLKYRSLENPIGPLVIFFSGSGSNSAPLNYSAYTLSKIALIKACELLNEEIPDTRFSIVGPGIINTKIHQPTILSKNKSGDNYLMLKSKIENNQCTDINLLMEFLDWLEAASIRHIGGRNFSLVYDDWKHRDFKKLLSEDSNIYKLRRFGNHLDIKSRFNKGIKDE